MLQIIGIALVGGIITFYLKTVNSEISIMAGICTGILLLISAFNYLSETIELFKNLSEIGKIDNDLLKLIIKIVAIGYIIEFAAGILEDFGLKGIAVKLIFVGKIVILTVSIPIFYALVNILTGLIT